MTRTPSGRRVSFSDMPETKYIEPRPKKRATSRAREVISDARKAQSTPTKYFHRPEKMTCFTCSAADVLFFCRACSHGTCLDCSATIAHAIVFISVQQSQTPIFRHRWVSTSAKRSQPKSISRFPSQPNPRDGARYDRYAGRLHRLQEMKENLFPLNGGLGSEWGFQTFFGRLWLRLPYSTYQCSRKGSTLLTFDHCEHDHCEHMFIVRRPHPYFYLCRTIYEHFEFELCSLALKSVHQNQKNHRTARNFATIIGSMVVLLSGYSEL